QRVSPPPRVESTAKAQPPGPEELLRDDRPRAGTEARPGPGARADVEDAVHRRPVSGLRRERPPEEVLVERERAAVGVAALEIAVGRLQVRGRENDPLQDPALQVAHVPRDPRLNAVGVALAQFLSPVAALRVDLSRRVALHVPRQLLQLDP